MDHPALVRRLQSQRRLPRRGLAQARRQDAAHQDLLHRAVYLKLPCGNRGCEFGELGQITDPDIEGGEHAPDDLTSRSPDPASARDTRVKALAQPWCSR